MALDLLIFYGSVRSDRQGIRAARFIEGQCRTEDGAPQDPVWEERAAKFLEELDWYARALRAQRDRDAAGERSECEAQALVGSAR